MAKKIESDALQAITVTIRAIKKKYQNKPFMAAMAYSSRTNTHLTGQEGWSAAKRKEAESIFTLEPNKNYPLIHTSTLSLHKDTGTGEYVIDKDYIMYTFFLTLSEVSSSLDKVTKDTLFVLVNVEEEAITDVSKQRRVAKAKGKIAGDLSMDDMYDMIHYCGENPINYSISRAESFLYKKADENPDLVLEYFENIDLNRKIVYIRKLITMGLVTRSPLNHYIMYGERVLGADEKEAAMFLEDDKNRAIYDVLLDQYNKKK
jgi:hypothetical protein